MKKSFLKKVLAAAAGLAVTMTMGITVYADDATLTDGVATSNEVTVKISKNIKVTNPDLTSVAGPGISYAYAVEPAAPSDENGGTTVTDTETPPHTANVHIGPADGVSLTTATLSWPVDEAVDASASGADNTKNIVAAVDITKFTKPGIFRYKITETPTPADPSSIGVTDSGDRVRYLDVYIENANPTGLQVAGYTCHDGSGAKKAFDDATFETKNIVLEKEVTGNMGDKNNAFPFTAAVSDNGRYFFAKKNAAPTASDAHQTAAQSTTLAHTEKFYISGLSTVATVNYTEQNNTEDIYKTSITGGTPADPTDVDPGDSISMGATDVDEAASVKFINDFESVSPTGVLFRYGAPLFILLAGILLIVLNRRSKRAKAEE